jgi:hypothetical protein
LVLKAWRRREAPIVKKALDDLHAEFAAADVSFSALLADMHLGDGFATGAEHSSDDDDDSDADMTSESSRPSSAGTLKSGFDISDEEQPDPKLEMISPAEVRRRREQAVLERPDSVEFKAETKDNNRLRMSIFGHVNKAVKVIKQSQTLGLAPPAANVSVEQAPEGDQHPSLWFAGAEATAEEGGEPETGGASKWSGLKAGLALADRTLRSAGWLAEESA